LKADFIMNSFQDAGYSQNSERTERSDDYNEDNMYNANDESQEARDEAGIEMNHYRPFAEKTSGRPGSSSSRRDRSAEDFRGFSTSIADMYRKPEYEQIDCCSIACFGCLQADRNRYMVTGVKPPGLCRRLIVHVFVPICIFGVALFVAFNVPDHWMNEMLCYGWVILFVIYFSSQCGKGSWKRRQVRRNLLWAKHKKVTSGRFQRRNRVDPEDTDDDSDDDDSDDEEYLRGQTNSDIRNAHAICGCYAVDQPASFEYDPEEEITCCRRLFSCFTNFCCAKLCCRHVVCCGFCGVAQEAREIKRMLRPGMLSVDYITMQPMMEYYPAIYEARCSDERPTSRWFSQLSKFSRMTVTNCAVWFTMLLVWSLLSRRLNHKFGPKNFIVLFLTLLQSLILLAAVYWKHTKDVSIDALIKFFAVGFCLSTTLAIFFELVFGLLVRLTMAVLMTFSGIGVVEGNGYAFSESGATNGLTAAQQVNYGGVNYRQYLKAYGIDHPVVYTVYLFVVSFLLAAMIEETCKYFGYRMVDHPDFYSKSEVEEAMKCYEKKEGDASVTSFSNQNRSFQSRAAAVTVSMVAVGVGFACCENLVYIFIYGKAYRASEIFILLARSLFPIHPIAAALQSIGVCKRDIESKQHGLGRIILPGVVFHGLYDFMLTWIDYIGSRKGNYVDEDDGIQTESGSGRISNVVSVFIVIGGVLYYFRERKKQKTRLASLDDESVLINSDLT